MRLGKVKTLSFSSVLVGVLAACDQRAPTTPPTPATSEARELPFEARFDAEGIFQPDLRVRPAWRDGKTFVAGKGDQYDDQRSEAPEHFAITEPPARSGIRPMVEWEPMQALVMSFPGYMLGSTNATQTVVQIAKIGSGYGEIWILVDGAQAETGLQGKLASAGVDASAFGTTIKFLREPFDSIWFIDLGPLPLVDVADQSFAFADFRYYHERPLDDGLPTVLGRRLPELGRSGPVTTYRMPLTVEGGTFQATTDGVCITSSRQIWNLTCYKAGCDDRLLESSLDDLQTHPETLAMEATLASYAGCKDLVVTHSITDDGTGHIDMYLKILDDRAVLVGEYDAASSNAYERENATLLDENAAFLEAYVKPDGSSFRVHRLPMPGHRSANGFGSVPFTYINSTFFNGVNLWPATKYTNWVSSRDRAQAVWDEVLPDHDNVWIDATELSFYSGAIHCITRTIPALAEKVWVGDGTCAEGTCAAPEHGYDDACQPPGVEDVICWGPAWLCGCNDCDGGCTGTPGGDDCQGVPYEGCCDGGDVVYCEGGQLYQAQCSGTGCGWNQWGGYYDCQQTGADPSGEFPVACGACEADCSDKACGDDGCGGSCGECAGDALCVAGECRDDCVACDPGAVGCDGAVAWFCEAGDGGCNRHLTVDCAARGLVCDAGLCVADAPDGADLAPEPGPEPRAEGRDEDLGPRTDAIGSVDGEGTDDREADGTGTKSFAKHSDGCAGARADAGLIGAVLAALAVFHAGRRARRARPLQPRA